MRLRLVCAIALVLAAGLPAQATTKTTVKIVNYPIAGTTGQALVDAMDRNGPKQGMLARAIAQTQYVIQWELLWRQTGKACRLRSATAHLSIDYRYPTLSRKVSPALSRRWSTFMTGVRRHEQTHGRLARQMATEADRAVTGVAFSNDPTCAKSVREVERIVGGVYAEYEVRQQRFDRTEHRDGGNVDRLVENLLGK